MNVGTLKDKRSGGGGNHSYFRQWLNYEGHRATDRRGRVESHIKGAFCSRHTSHI